MGKQLELLKQEGGLFTYKTSDGKVFTSKKDLLPKEVNANIDVHLLEAEKPADKDIEHEAQVHAVVDTFNQKMLTAANEHKTTLSEVFNETIANVKKTELSSDDINNQTGKIVSGIQQTAIIHQVQTNEEVQKKVLVNAEMTLLDELEIRRKEQQTRVQNATFDTIKDAAENLGIATGRPLWQLRIAQGISAVWFVIWALVASVSLTPITVILKGVRTMVKVTGLAWFFTLLFYIGLMFGLYCLIDGITGPSWGFLDFQSLMANR